MARRKSKRTPAPVLADPVAEADLREHTEEGLWKGLPNYVCRYCPAASLDPGVAVAHYRSEHAPPVARVVARTINTGLVTEDGSPIERVAFEPAEE